MLKVPIAESDHVRYGWWIEFRNVSGPKSHKEIDEDIVKVNGLIF